MCVCVCQVDEVMLTLKQAFTTAAALQSNKTQVQLCEACPMHDLHKLCERIEGGPLPSHLRSRIHRCSLTESESPIFFYFQVSTHPEQSWPSKNTSPS